MIYLRIVYVFRGKEGVQTVSLLRIICFFRILDSPERLCACLCACLGGVGM